MAPEAVRAKTIRLLDYDPELARNVSPDGRQEAHAHALVTVVELPRGAWTPGLLLDRSAYGLLLLDGLISREAELAGTSSMQLLGRGDLVQPAAEAGDGLVAVTVAWHVLEPATVALLDDRFLTAVRRWPEIVAALFERVAAQATRQATQRALCQLPRVEDRIHALLWFLAERWGRVTPQGVIVPLRLTHDALGRLVGAKRPTVSLAVKELDERGIMHRRPDGAWLLDEPMRRAPAPPLKSPAVGAVGFIAAEPPPPEPRLVRAVGTPASGGDEPGLAPPPDVGALPVLMQRIERIRGLHARARVDVEATLARAAEARRRSEALRAHRPEPRR